MKMNDLPIEEKLDIARIMNQAWHPGYNQAQKDVMRELFEDLEQLTQGDILAWVCQKQKEWGFR